MATDAGKVGPNVCARCRDWKRIGDSVTGLCGNPKIRFDETAETSGCRHFSNRDTARPMCPWPDCKVDDSPEDNQRSWKWHRVCEREAAAEALAAHNDETFWWSRAFDKALVGQITDASETADGTLNDTVERLVREALEAREKVLIRNQPCGCVVCVCNTEDRCLGCGARECRKSGCVLMEPGRPRAVYARKSEPKEE